MRPAGLAAFERRSDDKTAIYSYEQRKAAELDPSRSARFKADERRVGVVPGAAALLPADRDPLGHQRQEAGDPRAPPGAADRRLRRRAPDPAAHPATRVRRRTRVRAAPAAAAAPASRTAHS